MFAGHPFAGVSIEEGAKPVPKNEMIRPSGNAACRCLRRPSRLSALPTSMRPGYGNEHSRRCRSLPRGRGVANRHRLADAHRHRRRHPGVDDPHPVPPKHRFPLLSRCLPQPGRLSGAVATGPDPGPLTAAGDGPPLAGRFREKGSGGVCKLCIATHPQARTRVRRSRGHIGACDLFGAPGARGVSRRLPGRPASASACACMLGTLPYF